MNQDTKTLRVISDNSTSMPKRQTTEDDFKTARVNYIGIDEPFSPNLEEESDGGFKIDLPSEKVHPKKKEKGDSKIAYVFLGMALFGVGVFGAAKMLPTKSEKPEKPTVVFELKKPKEENAPPIIEQISDSRYLLINSYVAEPQSVRRFRRSNSRATYFQRSRSMKCVLICMLILVFMSCGTEEDPAKTQKTLGSPEITRNSPEECDNERPNQNFNPANQPSTNGKTKCDSDADCSEGDNGRCVLGYNIGRECTYDYCFNDDGCPDETVCSCGQDRHADFTFGRSDENICVIAACRTNADCGDQFCKPNSGQCRENEGRVFQYFCTTENDECRNDSDCSDDLICSFSADLKHWRCVSECQ